MTFLRIAVAHHLPGPHVTGNPEVVAIAKSTQGDERLVVFKNHETDYGNCWQRRGQWDELGVLDDALNRWPDVDYIGLMHYRRVFLTNSNVSNRPSDGPSEILSWDWADLKSSGLDIERLRAIMNKNTVVLAQPISVIEHGFGSVREQWNAVHSQEILDYAVDWMRANRQGWPDFGEWLDSEAEFSPWNILVASSPCLSSYWRSFIDLVDGIEPQVEWKLGLHNFRDGLPTGWRRIVFRLMYGQPGRQNIRWRSYLAERYMSFYFTHVAQEQIHYLEVGLLVNALSPSPGSEPEEAPHRIGGLSNGQSPLRVVKAQGKRCSLYVLRLVLSRTHIRRALGRLIRAF